MMTADFPHDREVAIDSDVKKCGFYKRKEIPHACICTVIDKVDSAIVPICYKKVFMACYGSGTEFHRKAFILNQEYCNEKGNALEREQQEHFKYESCWVQMSVNFRHITIEGIQGEKIQF